MNTEKIKVDFIDAQLMRKNHPTTFDAPTEDELKCLVVGDCIKVCPDTKPKSERFWAIVESVKGDDVTATVNNDLLFTSLHGIKDNDLISVKKNHIYNILKKADDEQ